MTTSEMEQQQQQQKQQKHSNGILQNGHRKGSFKSNELKARPKSVQFEATTTTITTARPRSLSSDFDGDPSTTFAYYSYSTTSTASSSSSSRGSTTKSLTAVEYLVHGAVLSLILAHILVAPFTKVEESFNLQAAHDILTFGVSDEGVKQYDHLEFPGVVPRTFVGPLLLAIGSWPIMALTRLFAIGSSLPKGVLSQIIVRTTLGLFTFMGWYQMTLGVRHQFGKVTSLLFLLVSSVQFHWLFYAGRTLPNTFALVIVNVAYSYWMQASSGNSRTYTEQRLLRMIDCLVVSTVLFRSELLLLLAPITLLELSMTRIRLIPTILEGIKAGFASLVIAVAVDSWFWRQWMWAEGAVFWFNAIQGKSVAWGVSPWHTYFSSLLPKISGVALPLALVAVVIEPRFRRYMLPAGVFVGLYSFLGHKEWRFVIYVVPVLNLGAAIALSWVIKRKTLAYRLLAIALFGALGLNFLMSVAQSLISSHNYPGGVALQRLHELDLHRFAAAYVHIDVAAAETGCSRFGEIGSQATPYPWTYSKNESHTSRKDYLHYTHLLTSTPEFHEHDFIILEQIDGYAGLDHVPLGQIIQSCPRAIKGLASNFSLSKISKDTVDELLKECGPLQIKKEGKIWIMRRFGAL
ncbi:dolichyl-P-Man:Man(7)GlcNAc(2)-PP-dolichol alpha-1,6-mannosyltransferase [Mortierella sp. AD010]|nr:dolichyl-P-Man:Man(7)GlcNAc(2)-PP-dolichol alpha-1,6-mannosyltransferase [Mortierella sp. AD010]